MAAIDLTLDSFKVPAIDGYTPPFGTMVTRTEANKGGLSTVEVNSNVMMPFANMRPKLVTEDSSTTAVEYDAKLCFSASLASGAVLTLGGGDYEGCRVQITNLSAYTCAVNYGGSTIVLVPAGANVEVLWTGSAWMLSTTETVAAGNVMAPTSAAVQAAISTLLSSLVRPMDPSNPQIITRATTTGVEVYTFTADKDCWVTAISSWGNGESKGAYVAISINSVTIEELLINAYGGPAQVAPIYVRKGQSVSVTWSGYNNSSSGMTKKVKIFGCI